jgi:serine/threonine protein kinase
LAKTTDELCAIRFGLFGTPQLQYLVGENARMWLQDQSVRSFSEASIREFIQNATKDGLQTTKQVRERLAKQASIATLDIMFARIGERLSSEGRSFVLTSDIEAIERDFIDSENSQIWGYWRQLLSEDDEWKPVREYAVALGLSTSDSVDREQRQLDALSWLTRHITQTVGVQLAITLEVVREAVDRLIRHNILTNNSLFELPLLERLLRHQSGRSPFSETEARRSLERLAFDVVPIPPSTETAGSGGQASVVVDWQEAPPIAYRRVRLDSEESRTRFLRTFAAIRALQQPLTRLDGESNLPITLAAGFSQDDENIGCVKYRWVYGETLRAFSSNGLNTEQALQVLHDIGRALAVLAHRGIVHRDIRPENIIVQPDTRCVLIDFGLACLSTSVGRTLGCDPTHVAPELLNGWPATIKSDVFALARVVGALQGEHRWNEQILILLERMQHPDVESRVFPSEVVNATERIWRELGFVDKVRSAERQMGDFLAEASTDVRATLEKAQSEFVAYRLGLQTFSMQTVLRIAHHLNEVFCIWCRRQDWGRQLTKPSLANIRHQIKEQNLRLHQDVKDPLDASHFKATGHLRNAAAHPHEEAQLIRRARKELRLNANTGPRQYLEALRNTAKILDRFLQSDNLIQRFVGLFDVQP